MRSPLTLVSVFLGLTFGAFAQIDTNKPIAIKGFVTLAEPAKLESDLLYYPLRFSLKFRQIGAPTLVTNRGIVSRVARPAKSVTITHRDFIASILAANNRQGAPASAYTLFCTTRADGLPSPEGNLSKRVVLVGSPSPNLTEEFSIRTNQLRLSPVGDLVRISGLNCPLGITNNVNAATPFFESGLVRVEIVLSNVLAAQGVLPYKGSESVRTFSGVGSTNCSVTTFSGQVSGVVGLPN